MKTRKAAAILVLLMVMICSVHCKKCDKKQRSGNSCKISQKERLKKSKSKQIKRKQDFAPRWRKGPPKESQLVLREGTQLTLSCPVRAKPKPKFSWKRNDKPLNMKKLHRLRQRKSRLSIKAVLVSDSGSYTCTVANRLGNITFTFFVKILENMPLNDIDIVDRPENQTAHVGDSVVFLCRSNDWPTPSVTWTRRTGPTSIIQTLEPDNSTDPNVLVVHNVTKRDSGEYTCFIGNDNYHEQLTATLTVIEDGETLPFEPQCSLHVRRQVLVDHSSGCKTSRPVEITYCMGSCGRSYYLPQMISDKTNRKSFKQTCQCCVGVFDQLRIVELYCPLGKQMKGFYTLFRECVCQSCSVDGEESGTQIPKKP